MIWFRRLHKWIGLLIAIQVTLWMLSGFMMGLLDHDVVQGHHRQAHLAPIPLPVASTLLEPAALIRRQNAQEAALGGLELRTLLGRAVYRLESGDAVRLVDAASGQVLEITGDVARRIALRDYSGEAGVESVTALQAPAMEVRRHEGPVWRVNFDDEDATSLYVSAEDGSILERRNDTWRLFDVFWMLHIMDYRNREDFNNTLVILAALVAAWFSITGIVLLFDSFKREDFLGWLPDHWWRTPATVSVRAPHGEVVARVDAAVGGRLYDELAKGGILLPSNCGGGGTCGLCVVTMDPATPESAADRRLIPEHLRQGGLRLACQAEVASTMSVAVSDEVLSAKRVSAEVIGARFLTPFIREITLKVPAGFDYKAGSYVHVIIPPHTLSFDDLEATDEVRSRLASLGSAGNASNVELRRAYSLATAPRERDREVVLNVRLIPPPVDAVELPPGIGSSYMWSVQVGDHLEIVGPLGDFHARAGDCPMIFIGGGAGMAPLRSIVRGELRSGESKRSMAFWYGARRRCDLFYVEDLDALQAEHANFRWQPVLSEPGPGDDWPGATGYVHALAEQGILSLTVDPGTCDYYVCGPPAMLAATRGMLAAIGVPEHRVYFDDFGI